MINKLTSCVLDNKSPKEILNSFYPHFITSNGLIPRVFRCTTLLVYIDDIIMTRNYEREKHELKQILEMEFEIKELGKLKYFLGIEVAYSVKGIFLSQQK